MDRLYRSLPSSNRFSNALTTQIKSSIHDMLVPGTPEKTSRTDPSNKKVQNFTSSLLHLATESILQMTVKL
uniref:AlNc14C276G10046 protein n=1 Tax=Albugo laibachii Nc14 TaxID=890382 RepID=F0WUN9_9STRA|nr:AlNc14C276G10046 [Albugo laibachii Nc14]|eukprot:CCA25120.1 AlNc14C276G10046 [Albugo laibachii Nc14]